MKKLSTIFFFLLLINFAHATQLFRVTLTLNTGWGEPYSTIKTLDGGIAFAGEADSGHYVIKMDSLGNIQWAGLYGFDVLGLPNLINIVQTVDSGYFLSYNGPSPLGYTMGANLARIDKNGNLLFAKEDNTQDPFEEAYCNAIRNIPGTDSILYIERYMDDSYIYKIAPNGDGTCLKATNSNTGYKFTNAYPITSGGVLEGYVAVGGGGLIKMDVAGNVVWAKTYLPSLGGIGFIFKEGNYYYGARFRTLVKIDLNGDIVNAITFPVSISGLALSNSGTLLLALNEWQQRFYMVEADTTFNILRSKITSASTAAGSSSHTLVDGTTGAFNFIVADTNYYYEKATLDTSCTFYDTTLAVTSASYTSSALAMPVNGIFELYDNYDAWNWLSATSVLDCSINLPGGTTSVHADKDPLNNLSAYPNPFTDEVNVILKTNDASTSQIKITDISGRIIIQRPIQSNTVYSFGEELAPGIYFIEALHKNRTKTVRVIKDN